MKDHEPEDVYDDGEGFCQCLDKDLGSFVQKTGRCRDRAVWSVDKIKLGTRELQSSGLPVRSRGKNISIVVS